jgi:thiol-disulfide isomerase/thioredoxin
MRVLRTVLSVILAGALLSCSTAPCAPNTTTQSTGITLQILNPDNSPANEAAAVLVPAGRYARIENADSFDADPTYLHATVSSTGDLHFPSTPTPFLILVLSDAGCAEIPNDQISANSVIHLKAWAKVEGRILVDGKPADGREICITASTDRAYDPTQPDYCYILTTASGMDGTFKFDRVPPGKIEVARHIFWYYTGHRASGFSQRHELTLAAGQSATITFGDAGRTLVGKLVLPPEISADDPVLGPCHILRQSSAPPIPIPGDLRAAPLPDQQKWYDQFLATPAGARFQVARDNPPVIEDQFPLQIAPDFTFHVDNVPPGSYTLYAEIYANSPHGTYKRGDKIAETLLPLQVPSEKSTDPLDLHEIQIQPFHPVPQPGDLAPDFHVQTLDGQPLSLSDFRGKFVLLDFWATWCGSCLGENPNIEAIYYRYASTNRLAIVSLSEDNSPLDPRHYVSAHDIPWVQGYIGPSSPVAQTYGIEGIPSIWLIDPNGKLLAKSLHGDTLRSAVADALKDSTPQTPPRP